MKVTWINYYHNGDIHVSRSFIRQIIHNINKVNPTIQFAYGHRNNPKLLSDISNLGFDSTALSIVNNDHIGLYKINDTTYINTWYAQQHHKYMNRYGITFDCLYDIFDDVCKTHFGFALSEIEPNPVKWFPTIDFSKFEISAAKQRLDLCKEPLVLVCNGPALSGQAENFSMLPAVCNLAKKYQGIVFVLTNHEPNFNPSQYGNIFYSSDIIKKNGFDLNENAFISTYCDLIVGRASGAYTFSFIQDNLFAKPKTFLCFSNLIPPKENTFWLSEKFRDQVQYTSKIIVSDVKSSNIAEQMIERNLNV